MTRSKNIGLLKYLHFEDIIPAYPTDKPEFVIKAAANLLLQTGGRNWLPLVVREIAAQKYEVIGNVFVYAVVEEAGLDKVWCVIADDSVPTLEISQVLAGEKLPKINLAQASRGEIHAALQFLSEQPESPLKGLKLAVATERIESAPRQSWKSLEELTKLKCGITKGKKLEVCASVFYLELEPIVPPIAEPITETITPLSETLSDPPTTSEIADDLHNLSEQTESTELTEQIWTISTLKKQSLPTLRSLAKEQGVSGISKLKKAQLVNILNYVFNQASS